MTEKNRRMEQTLSEFMKKALHHYDLPGLGVATGIGEESRSPYGGLSFAAGVGYRDFFSKEPATEQSIFHMASVTKLFVGTSILLLMEQGKLQLDEKLVSYLPWFHMEDERYQEITIRQLLSHTSGIPDVEDYGWNRPEIGNDALEHYVRSDEVVKAHLLWTPGSGKFSYSNIAYEILGVVIARVSGLPFEEYVKQYIFSPLDMRASELLTFLRGKKFVKGQDLKEGLNLEYLKRVGVCMPYRKDAENHIVGESCFPYNRAHGPSSTLTTNMADMAKWAKAHLKRSLLREETYEAAWHEEGLVPNNGEHICLSWFRREQKGYTLYGHEGTDDGFRASFWICPDLELYIVIASNLSNAPVKKISKQIFNLLTEEKD